MNWTMPYPWTWRSDSVRRINMSSEPGNESFFCALRPIPRILSLRQRDYASQVQIGEGIRHQPAQWRVEAPVQSSSCPNDRAECTRRQQHPEFRRRAARLDGILPPLFFSYHSMVASFGARGSALMDTTFFWLAR